MTDFKTRKRDKQVFPTGSGKEYRKDYSQDFSAKSQDPRPNFGTKAQTSQDIKRITDSATDRDTQTYDSKTSKSNFKRYKRNTDDKMKKQYKKHDKHAKRKQQKAQKKRDKQSMKIKKSEVDEQIKETEQKISEEYAEDQKDEAEMRDTIGAIEGNKNEW